VLASLDAQVQLDRQAPRAVAAAWLRAEGLVAAGPDRHGAAP